MTLTARHNLGSDVATPTIRVASRKLRYWAVAAVVLIVLGIISMIFSGGVQSAGQALSPTNASPGGSKALAQVLRKQGVTLTPTSTMTETRKAATHSNSTTIFVIDDSGYLDEVALQELSGLSSHLVILTPNFDQLRAVAPGVAHAGVVNGTLTADCSVSYVQRAELVTGDGSGFRVTGSGANTTACLASGKDTYSMVQVQNGESLVTVTGMRDAFANDTVLFHGNAAFTLGLLGETPNLVWFMPTSAEAAADGPRTAAELTPSWASAIMTLLILTALAAAFWRGRRMGPLVVEDLPVVVRASETMRGRGRLYQKTSDYLHILDALRMGTIDRLGVLCGLPTLANVDDVIRAVAHATGLHVTDVTNLLRDAMPTSEADLVGLSDSLLGLEEATATATRPASGTMDSTATTTQPEG